eukprot:7251522-Alexandrium_andersonii.AAC.1
MCSSCRPRNSQGCTTGKSRNAVRHGELHGCRVEGPLSIYVRPPTRESAKDMIGQTLAAILECPSHATGGIKEFSLLFKPSTTMHITRSLNSAAYAVWRIDA